MGRRELQTEIGRRGEENVAALLMEFFGMNLVSRGRNGYSDGTNLHPDIVLKTSPPVAIEVKSSTAYVNYKVKSRIYRRRNSIAISRRQWEGESAFASDRRMLQAVIMELRPREDVEQFVYYWVPSSVIDRFAEKSKALIYIHLALWDVFEFGYRLMTQADADLFNNWISETSPKSPQEVLPDG